MISFGIHIIFIHALLLKYLIITQNSWENSYRVCQGSWPLWSEKPKPGNTNTCRETQTNAGRWSWALNFGEFSGSNSIKKHQQIIGSIFPRMRVKLPGTPGITILFYFSAKRGQPASLGHGRWQGRAWAWDSDDGGRSDAHHSGARLCRRWRHDGHGLARMLQRQRQTRQRASQSRPQHRFDIFSLKLMTSRVGWAQICYVNERR